jgi:hypothetical protein
MAQPRKFERIGESVAAVGVVLSLMFVGYEINQNTQLSKAAALQAQAEPGADIALSWAADDKIIAIITRLGAGAVRSDFDEHENTKIIIMYIATLRSAEIRYRLHKLGILDDTTVLGGSGAMFDAPYLATEWDRIKRSVSPEFAQQFEAEHGIE